MTAVRDYFVDPVPNLTDVQLLLVMLHRQAHPPAARPWDWTPLLEQMQESFRDAERIIRFMKLEVGLVFSETGQFKYAFNWKE